jgi:hypothetical protein
LRDAPVVPGVDSLLEPEGAITVNGSEPAKQV